jgi:hypothetical protein
LRYRCQGLAKSFSHGCVLLGSSGVLSSRAPRAHPAPGCRLLLLWWHPLLRLLLLLLH